MSPVAHRHSDTEAVRQAILSVVTSGLRKRRILCDVNVVATSRRDRLIFTVYVPSGHVKVVRGQRRHVERMLRSLAIYLTDDTGTMLNIASTQPTPTDGVSPKGRVIPLKRF